MSSDSIASRFGSRLGGSLHVCMHVAVTPCRLTDGRVNPSGLSSHTIHIYKTHKKQYEDSLSSSDDEDNNNAPQPPQQSGEGGEGKEEAQPATRTVLPAPQPRGALFVC